jgi:hypothetical protein
VIVRKKPCQRERLKKIWPGFLFRYGKWYTMPWYNGDYPPSYKNQPKKIREKAVEIANKVLETTGNEGEAIATGLKQTRAHFRKLEKKK